MAAKKSYNFVQTLLLLKSHNSHLAYIKISNVRTVFVIVL